MNFGGPKLISTWIKNCKNDFFFSFMKFKIIHFQIFSLQLHYLELLKPNSIIILSVTNNTSKNNAKYKMLTDGQKSMFFFII